MARTHSGRLLRGIYREEGGAVCSVAPYEGRLVKYAPRHRSDSHPWVIPGVGYRYSGRECHLQRYDDEVQPQPATPG